MTIRLNNNLAKIFACLLNSKEQHMIFTPNNTLNKIFADQLQNNLTMRKHLKNMEACGLVKQEQIGMYSLTTVGDAIIECYKGLEFLEKNVDFFADHGFGDMPKSLLKNIGSLTNSQFYNGIHLVLSKWSRIISESQEFVHCIFSQPPIVIADYLGPKIQKGLKAHILFDNSKIPDCNEFVNKMRLRELKTNENFKKRITESAKINLIMSEKEACVIFPDNTGVVDMMGNFISSDPDFVSWCKDFFEYKWNDSEPIARLR